MRGWGFTFIGVAVAGVVLPGPLGWFLLVPVAVVFIASLVVEVADRRVQRSLDAAAETAKHQAWNDRLKQLEVDDDEAWARLSAAIDLHPAPLVYPGKLRSVPIPAQRDQS